MNTKNKPLIIAGALNLFTALVHTIGGQLDLVNPLLKSNLSAQATTEWTGAWHMVTVMLFASSYYLLRNSFGKAPDNGVIHFIGILYMLFALAFLASSVVLQVFTPQWVILLPIGILALRSVNGLEDKRNANLA